MIFTRLLLSEVDDVFSGFQHDLLAVVANDRPHHALGVGVLVHAAVTKPAGPMREHFPANAAAVRLEAIVLHAVRPRRRQVQEPLAARLAVVARVALVDRRAVTSHRRHVRETPGTLGALMGSVSRVHRHVLLQVAELRKLSTARVACERAHVFVQVHMHLYHMFINQLINVTA